uniref:Uncharacterized protein n=1 Tax=Rhizobium phage IG49 TaxID=3129228 RepID=A0AAU8HYC6_9CAUD
MIRTVLNDPYFVPVDIFCDLVHLIGGDVDAIDRFNKFITFQKGGILYRAAIHDDGLVDTLRLSEDIDNFMRSGWHNYLNDSNYAEKEYSEACESSEESEGPNIWAAFANEKRHLFADLKKAIELADE